ncbi:inositol 1,4,5-trisphosphate receptor-interacting protein-like 2 [Anolis carolinensis]|uniref:inositol 1,4,5-trisphosphate receptor-interacting protein-like 2 n=1 Tax=Anolis carolinensis TaxID=28377 RepID=UPI002F2B40A6
MPAMTTASSSSSYYRLNERVFWPLALLCLWQAWRSRAIEGAVTSSSSFLKERSLLLLVVLLLLGAWALRRRLRCQQGAKEARVVQSSRVESKTRGGRRLALEAFSAEQQLLRPSPHVLGHSKARLAQVAAALAKAGREGRPSGMSLRGDWVLGGAHKQPRRPGAAFEVLLPLRLPLGVRLRVAPSEDPRGVFSCALEVSLKEDGAAVGALCVEGPQGDTCLSSALTLRWFAAQLKRSLRAVRCGLQEQPSLDAGPGRAPILRLGPCPDDYVCSHLCLSLRLIPALPVGKGLFLTPLPGHQGALWTLDTSRLWDWVREHAPQDACHLQCLRILEGLRDRTGHALGPPLRKQWSRILRFEVLEMALLRLLLLQRGPWGAWGGRRLEERLGELVAFLVGALQKRRMMHLFLGSGASRLPPALGLPRMLKEADPVNLLAGFEEPSLDRVALRLWDAWQQAETLLGGNEARYQDGRKHPH